MVFAEVSSATGVNPVTNGAGLRGANALLGRADDTAAREYSPPWLGPFFTNPRWMANEAQPTLPMAS
jgi:hypothetical protein